MIVINKWYGRLGNNIIQLKNALHIGIFNNVNVKIPNHNFFNTNIIFINSNNSNNDNNNTQINNITDKFDFFYKDRINVNKEIFDVNNERIKQILQSIVNITIDNNNNDDNDDRIKQNTLIIHIRSGDIFSGYPHPKYIPPPYKYYSDIIDTNNYKFIQIISEDEKNPVIKKLLSNYPNIKYKKQSLIQDIKIILNNQNIVSSIGTFIPALLYISNNVKKNYNISYNKFFLDFVNFEDKNVIYNTINYQDYYDKIKPWKANNEQIKLLLNYNLNI